MQAVQDTNLQKSLDVLIVDDHRLILDTLVLALKNDGSIEAEGVTDIDAALERIEEKGSYDIILLDYLIPSISGMDALHSLSRLNAGKVVLFSGVASWPVVQNAMKQGASGFIPKTTPIKTLILALKIIADGELYLPYEYVKKISNEETDDLGLKPRERQVLAYLCEGMQNKEIGREVGIEEVIVKMDVKSICRKLGVRNRTEAALAAKKHGIF